MSQFEHRFWLTCLILSAFFSGFASGSLVYLLTRSH
jgi:hypothetical protein